MGNAPIIAIIGGHSGTAWDLSVANYSGKSVSLVAQDIGPNALAFSSDGTKMYVADDGNAATSAVYQYTLSTAWDVNSAVYANKSCVVGVEETRPWGLAFSADGSKMYVVGLTNDTVYQYALDPAWDVSTGAYASKSVSVNAEDTQPAGIAFSADGSKMYMSGYTNNTVYQYALDPAWDVSTAVYASKSKDVSAQEDDLMDVFLSSDGTKMYIVGLTNDTVYQYTLGTAWDVSTASYASSKSVAAQEINPRGLTFSADGYRMYVAGNTQTVYQYTLYV